MGLTGLACEVNDTGRKPQESPFIGNPRFLKRGGCQLTNLRTNMLKKIIMSALISGSFIISAAYAAPKQLITHNHTNVESNAFVDGVIASQHPTKANSDNKVFWASVKVACYGRTKNNECRALIKMATDTANPVDLGWATINIVTGEIYPQYISGNGYHLVVDGPGETSIYQDN